MKKILDKLRLWSRVTWEYYEKTNDTQSQGYAIAIDDCIKLLEDEEDLR